MTTGTEVLPYTDFKVLAAKEGIEELTEEEYNKFVVGKPKITARGQVKLVAGFRRDNANKTTETVEAYSIGAFDFTTTKTSWGSTRTQMVKLLTKDGKIREALNRGTFLGHHGREVEVELSNKEDSPFWMVEKTTVGKNQMPLSKLPWKEASEFMDYRGPAENEFPTLFIAGEISGVYNVKNLDGEKDDDGRYPDYGINMAPPIPTVAVLIRTERALTADHLEVLQIYANFGPHKHAIPWIKGLADFQLDGIESSRELGDVMKGQRVGIIAVRPNIKEGETQEGHDLKKIYLKGIAMIALDGETPLPIVPTDKMSEQARAAVTRAPAGGAADRLNELKGKIKVGLSFIPLAEATPEALKQANYIEGFWPDELVQKAIQTVADELNADAVAIAEKQSEVAKQSEPTATVITKSGKVLSASAAGATVSPSSAPIVPPDQFEGKDVRKVTRLIGKLSDEMGAEIDMVIDGAKQAGIEEKKAEDIIEWLLDAGHASEPVLAKVKLA